MKRRWLTIGLLAAVAVLAGCEPRAAVTVLRDGSGYQLQFANCSQPGQTLPVKRVEVHRTSAAAGEPAQCVLERSSHSGELADSWRYGEAVPGYQLEGCAPLSPGETYRVHVSLGPVAAESVVAIAADGSVRSAAACK